MPVQFKKVKNIRFSILPFKGLQVTAPMRIHSKELIRIIQTKRKWIKKTRQRLKDVENRYTLFTTQTRFSTFNHNINIIYGKNKTRSFNIFKNSSRIVIPTHSDIYSNDNQKFIRHAIDETMRYEARQDLPNRINDLALKHGFKFNKLYLKNLKSRWGSCSGVNNINLNIQLMRLPDHLINYIIMHELCHTIQKNHSRAYWDLLSNHITDLEQCREDIKNFSCKIY